MAYDQDRDNRRVRTEGPRGISEGERLKGYTFLLTRIRQIGLKAIIEGSERDLKLLRKLGEYSKEKPKLPS